MKEHAWLWTIGVAAVLGGCQHEVYQVDMAVERNEIARSISVAIEAHGTGAGHAELELVQNPSTQPPVRASSAPSTQQVVSSSSAPSERKPKKPTEPSRIAGIYKVDPTAPHPWKRRFLGRTPDDVGGTGEVAWFKADMGSAWAYLERFRGDQDPASTLQSRLQAADTLACVVAGWARARLRGRKDFEKLGAYLDGDLRKDLKNLSLFIWMTGAVRGMRTPQESEPSTAKADAYSGSLPISLSSGQLDVVAVVVQYLIEHEYLDLEDAPIVMRVFGKSDVQRVSLFKGLWRKFLTKKIGLTDKDLIEHLVSIFDRQDEVQESFEEYVRNCKQYKDYVAGPPKPQPEGGPSFYNKPTASGFMGTLLAMAFTPPGMNFLNTDDELWLTLATRDAPVLTNGTWSKKTGKISWVRRLRPAGSLVGDPLPAVCFAAWARPNEKFQKTHFGKVILRGQPLLEYCLWRNSLTAKQAKEWGVLMASLKPGTASSQAASFRFSTTRPAPSEGAGHYATVGLKILDEAFRK